MSLTPGTQLGRYRIVRRIGAGAMGEVYLAEDPQIERQLALKTVRVLAHSGADPGELEARLLREAKAAGRLVHSHVVTLFDAGEADGLFFLAFEYVEGPDLSQRMKQAPALTLGEILRITREAAEGLAAAHRRDIVHRDIKPSNILLDCEGRVKVSDFGIAKMVGQQTELTQTGSVVGSPHYLSPEQVRGESLDGRSDLFSLGVVLYEMLTRKRPFDGESITTLVYQILSREPTPIEEVVPSLPAPVREIVDRLLEKEKDERFSDAPALIEALKRAERGLPPDVLTAPILLPRDAEETVTLPSGESGAASAEVTGPTVVQAPPGPAVPPPPTPTADGAPAERAPAAAAASPPAPRRRGVLVALAVGFLLLVGVALGVGALWWGFQGRSAPVPDLETERQEMAFSEDEAEPAERTPPEAQVPVEEAPAEEAPAEATSEAEEWREEVVGGEASDSGSDPRLSSETDIAADASPDVSDRASEQPATPPPAPVDPPRQALPPDPEPEIERRDEIAEPREDPRLERLREAFEDREEWADLPRYRTGGGIVLDLSPRRIAARGRVLVDGEIKGQVEEYAGGRNPLRLPPGNHHVAIVVPGFERVEFVVEVRPRLAERLQRVEIELSRDR